MKARQGLVENVVARDGRESTALELFITLGAERMLRVGGVRQRDERPGIVEKGAHGSLSGAALSPDAISLCIDLVTHGRPLVQTAPQLRSGPCCACFERSAVRRVLISCDHELGAFGEQRRQRSATPDGDELEALTERVLEIEGSLRRLHCRQTSRAALSVKLAFCQAGFLSAAHAAARSPR